MTTNSLREDPPPLRLYAHRGACLVCPENTIEAFRQGIDDGADALELDVHATADGEFVVAHDPDGRRLAGDSRAIRSLPLHEIRRWRVSEHACSLPTLREVLTAFPDVPMSIDLKPNVPSLVPPLVATLVGHGAETRATIASFHHRVMRAVHASSWSGATALSRLEIAALRGIPAATARRLIRGTAAQIPRTVGPLRLDSRHFIDRCRRLGLRADYWVVNDPEEARELLARGATGLMTDDPARIAPVLRQFEAESQRIE